MHRIGNRNVIIHYKRIAGIATAEWVIHKKLDAVSARSGIDMHRITDSTGIAIAKDPKIIHIIAAGILEDNSKRIAACRVMSYKRSMHRVSACNGRASAVGDVFPHRSEERR